MTGRLWPIPEARHAGGSPTLPLAGSRHVAWDLVNDLSDGAQEHLLASDLAPEARNRLSALRPAICGLSLDEPRIMGILNVTPDSFSDGGRHDTLDRAVAHALAIAPDADLIDIGGESTRPGAREVPEDEEIARTAPVIRALRAQGITTPISIDTRKAAVAEAALDAGADMVNDVTALRWDTRMAALCAERAVPVCLMHSVADPETMQAHAHYRDVTREVYDHLAARIDAALAAGIRLENIITDPGIGFGKTLDHNLDLLRKLAIFHDLGAAVLLGASRKRFIGTLGLADDAAQRMPGSVAVALHGAAQGVQVLRVHDVAETRQALRLWAAIAGENQNGGPA